MTTNQSRAKYTRQAKVTKNMSNDKTAEKIGEKTVDKGKTSGEDLSTMSMMLGKVLTKMNEDSAKAREMERTAREMDKRANEESIKLLSDKLEALQMAQLKSIESQKLVVQTPLPKYSGRPGEFDDWKQGVLTCIKTNDWTDERRVLEIIPSALSGQAHRVYTSFTNEQKTSLEAMFAALKHSLEPEGQAYNRELFVKAKRNPGESMRAFVSRCNVYITRADDIDNVADSTWANPFIVEKIYANLSPLDRKLLKNSMGKSDDVQKLCEKADELLSMSEEVVASFETNHGWKDFQAQAQTTHAFTSYPPQPPQPFTPNRKRQGQRWGVNYQGWNPRGIPGGGPQGSLVRGRQPHMFRPGGGDNIRGFSQKQDTSQGKKQKTQHPLN